MVKIDWYFAFGFLFLFLATSLLITYYYVHNVNSCVKNPLNYYVHTIDEMYGNRFIIDGTVSLIGGSASNIIEFGNRKNQTRRTIVNTTQEDYVMQTIIIDNKSYNLNSNYGNINLSDLF